MESDKQPIVFAVEAESYISTLEAFDIRDIGSPRWVEQHFRLSKLTVQAVLHATNNEEEFVKEAFVSTGKIDTIVTELIVTNVWKEKILPHLQGMNLGTSSSIPLYNVIHHEAIIINLLEVLLYHDDALQSFEIVDQLIDYCHNKIITCLLRQGETFYCTTTNLPELYNPRELSFGIAFRALSVLCYICEDVSSLSASVIHRLLTTYDIPLLLVQLIEEPPWLLQPSETTNCTMKYFQDKWERVNEDNNMQLSKFEAMVWVALLKLLLDPECQKKYNMNGFKKSQILKLRGCINDVLVDQLPCLITLKQFLEHLSIFNPPPSKPDLIIDQSLGIRDTILMEHDGKWNEIAKQQADLFFNLSQEDIKMHAQRLSDTYTFDVLESLSQETFKCPMCNKSARKKCSQCQKERYCSRECQVKHWPLHKPICNAEDR